MLSRLPLLIEFIVEQFASLPGVFLIQQDIAVYFEKQPALVIVEYSVDEPLAPRQVQDQLIAAGMLSLESVRHKRRLVIGQRERAFAGPRGSIAIGWAKASAGDPFFGDRRRGRRHGLGHD